MNHAREGSTQHVTDDANPYAAPQAIIAPAGSLSWRAIWQSAQFRAHALGVLGLIRIISGLLLFIAFWDMLVTHPLWLCLPVIVFALGSMITGWEMRSCYSFGRKQAIALCVVQIAFAGVAFFAALNLAAIIALLVAIIMPVAYIRFMMSPHTRAVCHPRQLQDMPEIEQLPRADIKVGVANAGLHLFALADFFMTFSVLIILIGDD